jgi:subtilisin family serine protease
MARHTLVTASLALTALAACGDPSAVTAPAKTPTAPSLGVAAQTTSRYIIKFKPGVAGGSARAQAMVGGGGRLKHTFTRVFQGFSAELSESAVKVLRMHPDIELVEADPVLSVGATQASAPWGLDRLDQRALPLSTTYTYGNDGSGVTVYILDTGINTAHVDFGGRAVPGFTAIDDGRGASDCHGHGTHVAGTVGGTTFGVAKGVRLVAVRVLDCAGNGAGSDLVAALDWIAAQKAAAPATPMVMNMSLGGTASQALDDAVQNVISQGVVAAVAAGNAGADACLTSPARLATAITVGATDASDVFASFSNYGACVDLEAPGVSILSASYSSTTGSARMSGTSMATPHVAGAAALYLKTNPTATPAQVSAALVGAALGGVVNSLPTGTVNKLLNVSFLAAAPAPRLDVSPTSAALTIGGKSTLTASVANPVSGATLTWVSRKPALVTVAATGAATASATAVAPGSAYVVATYTAGATTVRDSALVTVAAPAIAVSPKTASVVAGATTALAATVTNGGTGGSTTWTSRSAGVATVGATGTVTGVAAGSVYVVASYIVGGTTVRDSAYVTVTAPAPLPAGTSAFASATGRGCITAVPVTSWGTATVKPCVAGQSDQAWTAPASGVQGIVTIFAGKRCLTGFNGGTVGNAIGTYACTTGWVSQQWTYVAATGQLRLPNGNCAAAITSATTGATTVAVRACDGSTAQRWTRQ